MLEKSVRVMVTFAFYSILASTTLSALSLLVPSDGQFVVWFGILWSAVAGVAVGALAAVLYTVGAVGRRVARLDLRVQTFAAEPVPA